MSVQRKIAKDAAPILNEAHKVEDGRRTLLRRLGFISPATLMQTALEDIAGSGVARYAVFEAQAEAYHAVFTQHFYGMIDRGESFKPASFALVPRFQFVDEAEGEVYRRVGVASSMLGCLGLLLIGLATPRLRQIGRLTR